MPQLFTFLHCLNPKPRAITAQNNLWPLSTSLGLSPFLLFYKATASDWDETNSLGASELRVHPAAALGFFCEHRVGCRAGLQGSQILCSFPAAAGGRQDMAQSTELTKLPMFGDAGTTPWGQQSRSF